MIPGHQYEEVISERDSLKIEVCELQSKLKDLETRILQIQKNNNTNPKVIF